MEFFDVFAKKIPATAAPGEFLLGFVRNSFAIADGGFAEIETIPSANKVVEKPVKLLIPLHYILTVAVITKDNAKQFGFTDPRGLVEAEDPA